MNIHEWASPTLFSSCQIEGARYLWLAELLHLSVLIGDPFREKEPSASIIKFPVRAIEM